MSMMALLICVLAISVSAKLIPLDSDPGLDCDESVISTFDYDAFVNSTAIDKDSKVVMTDGTKYYVFPSYYIMWGSTYGYSFENLNKAIKASDSGITTDMFTSIKTQLVRAELMQGITTIGGIKFEYHTALKEVIFPQGFKGFTAADTFGGCTSLEYVSSIENFTSIGVAAFTGCKNLEIDVIWPSAVTSVPQRVFQNCNKIKSITFSEGLTSVGEKAFQNCNAITEVIMPNTFKTAGKHAFGSMSGLVTLNFGAGFTTFTSSNFDYETTQGSTGLKYVYLPSGIYENVSQLAVGYGRHIFGAGKNVTFFFAGDQKEAQNLKDHFAKIGNNAVFANATLVKYDPKQNYEGYADSLGYSIIVYDYSSCEAFYDGAHDISKVINYGENEKLFSKGNVCSTCSKCTYSIIEKEIGQLVKSLGYSYSSNAVMQGFVIDQKALKEYEDFYGIGLSYGLVATGASNVTDGKLLEAERKATVEYTNKKSFDIFEMKISGFASDEQKNLSIYVCGYVRIGESTYYLNNGVSSEDATDFSITYNSIANIAE